LVRIRQAALNTSQGAVVGHAQGGPILWTPKTGYLGFSKNRSFLELTSFDKPQFRWPIFLPSPKGRGMMRMVVGLVGFSG
jgi:hypothetical protein